MFHWLKSLWDLLWRHPVSTLVPQPPGAGAKFTPVLTVPLARPARIDVLVYDWALLRRSRAVNFLTRSAGCVPGIEARRL